MSNGEAGGNPLFFHAIVLFVVAALLVGVGVVGIVQIAKAQGVEMPGSAADMLKKKQDFDRDVNKTKQLTNVPGGAADAVNKMKMGQEMGDKAKGLIPYLAPILMIAWGLATAAAGLFVLWKTNWARFVGFFLVFATVLYYTWIQSVAQSDPEIPFAVWQPLVLCMIAGLAGKFLFDLWVEKFPPEIA